MRYVVKNGTTDFTIWLPLNASEHERFAAEELRLFCGKATGCRLKKVTKQPEGPYFRLITGTDSGDGYTIRTEKNGYVIVGDGEHGLVYGVYALCRELFGLEFFSQDVWTLENKADIKFINVNLKDKPDIPLRAIGIYPLHDESTETPLLPASLRMRARGMGDGWGICNHSYFRILPREEYAAAHPDWYSSGDDGINLCLTNDEMRIEFTERLKAIVSKSKAKCFMIGQQDNTTFCDCPRCRKALQEHGGYKSALMIKFTNAVVKSLNEWLAENEPEREVVFCMFAYQQTVEPPTQEVMAKLAPIENNLAVMMAPLFATGDVSYFDETNFLPFTPKKAGDIGAPLVHVIKGWKQAVNRLFFWAYDIDYADSLVPFNGWDAYDKNYDGFKEFGVEYLFLEGTYLKPVPNFNALRTYVHANKMWDTSLKSEDLILRFMRGYYGDAAEEMTAYFNALREHCRGINHKHGRPMFYVRFDDFVDMCEPQYWSLDCLRRLCELHKKALAAASGKARGRIRIEIVPVYYLMLTNYADELSERERKQMAKLVTSVAEKGDWFNGCEGLNLDKLNAIKAMCS